MTTIRGDFESRPTISQRQILVILLTVGLLTASFVLIFLQERGKDWRLHTGQTSHSLDLAEEILARDLARVRADLLFVASLPEIRNADSDFPESCGIAAEVFKGFVISQQAYSQVRLIDRDGAEVVRVDWNGTEAFTVEKARLQNKAARYYVRDSLALKPEQIFTSEFDLNLENGEIEKPLKPVVRFVSPVSREGKPGNLLVFNYQGAALLDELAAISIPGDTYLVRSDGMFLKGPEKDTEWGWLLKHSNTFQSRFKAANLASLIKTRVPQNCADGIFQARELSLDQSGAAAVHQRQPLFFVSHIARENAFQSSRKLLFWLLLVGGIMLVPLALVTRFWAASIDRREWQNEKIRRSEERLRELSSQLVSLQEEERRSIAREIHDSLGQQATAINLDLRMLKDQTTSRNDLERVISESDALLKALHEFATRVRPAELDDLGLKEALESHAQEFESRTGIVCDLKVEVDPVLVGREVGSHIFRVVQESLNNVAKHAKAEVTEIKLNWLPEQNQLRLEVSDDGVGMDLAARLGATDSAVGARLGIVGIRERVQLLNGSMDISNGKNGGTSLVVIIPLGRVNVRKGPAK